MVSGKAPQITMLRAWWFVAWQDLREKNFWRGLEKVILICEFLNRLIAESWKKYQLLIPTPWLHHHVEKGFCRIDEW